MKKILFRADDLGYSEGVNLGIAKSVKEGMIQSVGLMANMETAPQGVQLLKDCKIALGLHCNISAGKPITPCDKIPSLVNEANEFKKSGHYKQVNDIVVIEEALMEIEAQVLQFKKLTGVLPAYMDGHAVASLNFFEAIQIIAKKYNIMYSPLAASEKECIQINNTMVFMHAGSSLQESPTDTLHNIVEHMNDGECHLLVYHPGFIDAYILENSSLTTHRAFETKMLCDKQCSDYIKEKHVHQITYEQL